MTYPESITIDGVTFTVGERLCIDYHGEEPLRWAMLTPGIYCLTRIYLHERTGQLSLSGHRAQRPGQRGHYWSRYLTDLSAEGYVFRKLGYVKGKGAWSGRGNRPR